MAITVNWVDETANPGEYCANITVGADADTLSVPINAQVVLCQPNRDNAAADSWGCTFTKGGQLLTFQLIGTTTNVEMSVLVRGTQ